MFVRADRLWQEMIEERLPLHVLEFSWRGFEPRLECFDVVGREVVETPIASVDLLVGRGKRCVGSFVGDEYMPCPDGSSVTKFSQCDSCAEESFIEDQECIFEPKCEGERCGNEFCSREHVLYLAFYNAVAKVGMSSTRRVERRLVEQGADAFALIGTFPNRMRARAAEKLISSRLRLPQGIRQQMILSMFSQHLDESGIGTRYDGLKRSLVGMQDLHGLKVEPLRMISGYPIDLPLSVAPDLQETPGMHRGHLLGVKGKWLVYESGGVRALSLPDLVGRNIRMGPP